MKSRCALTGLALPLSLLLAAPVCADPLDPGSEPLEASYRSVFEGYQQDQDIEVGGWSKANQRVGEIGGWRTYLRQAQEPVEDSNGSDPQETDPSSSAGATQ